MSLCLTPQKRVKLETKRCATCGQEKLRRAFPTNRQGHLASASCAGCRNAKYRAAKQLERQFIVANGLCTAEAKYLAPRAVRGPWTEKFLVWGADT